MYYQVHVKDEEVSVCAFLRLGDRRIKKDKDFQNLLLPVVYHLEHIDLVV